MYCLRHVSSTLASKLKSILFGRIAKARVPGTTFGWHGRNPRLRRVPCAPGWLNELELEDVLQNSLLTNDVRGHPSRFYFQWQKDLAPWLFVGWCTWQHSCRPVLWVWASAWELGLRDCVRVPLRITPMTSLENAFGKPRATYAGSF
jgi:hypothetical protein